MKWKSMELFNIQSWEHGKIEFNQDGLTVIEAKSETGKSVFIKCLRLGLYYDEYDAKTRKAIIRNYPDNQYGDFVLELEDNTLVLFRFYDTKVMIIIKYSSGETQAIDNSNKQDLAKLLNLITCKNSHRILNILDNETPMLYDTTDMEYNTNIMSLYLDHEDLRTRKNDAESFLKRLKHTESNVKYLLKNYTEKLAKANYSFNIDKIEKHKERCSEINSILNQLEEVQNVLVSISNISLRPTINLKSANDNYNLLNSMYSLQEELNSISVLKELNTLSDTQLNLLNTFRQYLSHLSKLKNILTYILSTLVTKPVMDLAIFSSLNEKLNILCSFQNELKSLSTQHNIVANTNAKLSLSMEAIETFKEENKTCPLCGQLWGCSDT